MTSKAENVKGQIENLNIKEELLDKKNDLGIKDLTAYNAVNQMITNGREVIALR